MDEYASLSHTKWDCKYHVVFIPKCRRKVLYKNLRQHLGEVFHSLAQQRESQILEGHLLSDHVHILISIPPKHAVSQVVGFIKGKSAIHLARTYGERKQNYAGQNFWARGYLDRKSTRLNSSHLVNSYDVFCLKKKYDNMTLKTDATRMTREPALGHTLLVC